MNRKTKRRKRNLKLFFFLCVGSILLGVIVASIPFFLSKLPEEKVSIISPTVGKNGTVFEKALKDAGIQFDSVTYSSQSATLIVYLKNGMYAYLDISLPPASSAGLLSKILTRAEIENPQKKVSYIDLRFDKAIVKF